MSSIWILTACFMFSLMGVCVKFASLHYSFFEIVAYRGVIGVLMMSALIRWQGGTVRTTVPLMHVWRSVVGVTSLCLWIYSFTGLPLATAVTLNATAPIWMAAILMSAGLVMTGRKADWRLTIAIIISFIGVAMVLKPTIKQDQLVFGLIGLLSGLITAFALLQVAQLTRVGEPESRIVFYFSIGSVLAGAAGATWLGWHALSWPTALWLLAIGVLAGCGQMAITIGYNHGKTLVNANLGYSGIIFSSVMGWLFFSDSIDWIGAIGMAVITASGIAATIYRPKTDPPDTAISPN